MRKIAWRSCLGLFLAQVTWGESAIQATEPPLQELAANHQLFSLKYFSEDDRTHIRNALQGSHDTIMLGNNRYKPSALTLAPKEFLDGNVGLLKIQGCYYPGPIQYNNPFIHLSLAFSPINFNPQAPDIWIPFTIMLARL